MNKMKFLLVCSAALAAGISFADTTANGVTPFDQLKFENGTTFSAVASSGLTRATLTPANPTVDGGYYMIDGELTGDAALAMAADGVTKTDIEQFTIEFKAGFVEASELAAYGGAKIGFALTSGTTAKYFNGTSWVAFDEFAEVAEEANVVLTVDFDGRLNQARFTLGNEVLTASESEWVSVGGDLSNTIKAFGSGAVKSLAGLTRTITAEEIVIPAEEGKKAIEVEIPEEKITKMGDPAATNAKISGMSNIEVFILTGKAGDEVVKPVAKIETTSADNTKVNFNLTGVDVQQITNGSVKFILEGSNGNEWEQIGDAATSPTIAMPISNAATYKFFRVKAKVEADPANN